MNDSRLHLHWEKDSAAAFRSAVSLHSHTLHSRESMEFVRLGTKDIPWLGGAIRRQELKYRELKGRDLDLSRAWWTPPLSAGHAWALEKNQIETALGKSALVSLTDHDNIEASSQLSLLADTVDSPVSVEWTIPFRGTFFHIGVHNLPPDSAASRMREMRAVTANPDERRSVEMLEALGQAQESLIVFNHPMWDENHVGAAAHFRYVNDFLTLCRPFLHAVELNGLRPWQENRKAAELAASVSLPVISGGDRHGREPNACLNLTNAATFGEFAEEVRRDKWSDVLFMPQYRDSLRFRILENLCDILADDPDHALGWVRWSDRVFYLTDEGNVKSLKEFWGSRIPGVVNQFVALMKFIRNRNVRAALRMALYEGEEVVL
jgi:hypothetical protein